MNRREFQTAVGCFFASSIVAPFAQAAGKPRRPKGLPNVQTTTNGGQQFWGDVRYHAGYRIQEHALTGHFRLLDPQYERVTWGTLEACESQLSEIRQQNAQLSNESTAVIYLHGLFRSRWSMSRMANHINQQTGWQSIVLGYASTRGSVGDHANKLAQVIEHLDGVKNIHFVAHSLGNLVIRYWLGDKQFQQQLAQQGAQVGRMVMVGPPNHRPSLAQVLTPLDTQQIIGGESASQLAEDWKELAPKLATPSCDFGILAGGKGDESGHNPLIPGDDDMIVGVKETMLPGASDFRVLDVIHATMMYEPNIMGMATEFLQHGYFESAEARHPLGKVTIP
ncbi:esterase/lipase family protein [Aeoliella mucimassa]|uniref:Alpha/beta hydrolase family protein n=1 Tax=Aeoliella mucimassa TaxID=2527972 RepID=A0A518AJ05_9BACT|nr:hypothetical protein [Aeoliella mucimassa]QDU54713.1 Alpha/beta hydrolase family protein [Aeoliella mucimassa]